MVCADGEGNGTNHKAALTDYLAVTGRDAFQETGAAKLAGQDGMI